MSFVDSVVSTLAATGGSNIGGFLPGSISSQIRTLQEDLSSSIIPPNPTNNNPLFSPADRVVVTDQAMGARCAVAADFDGDGRLDLVSASSNDNAVSWYQNLGGSPPNFSIKKKITWSSLGSRIVTAADMDGDGDQDVVGASYYDSSLRWFENDGTGVFTEHLISSAVNEGQGVTVADLDNDGDPDIATASSGDNTIAVFKNIANGTFCEIKEIVDDNAIGARTVVASDLNGDGWVDLASASKDDDTVAWYPNDGTGHFPTKIIISQGEESTGAYSLVATDVDQDGHNDLVVASNGNDHVSLWRNDGTGKFTKTLIYDNADFVLSVTAIDFDRDGDIDVASASFFDGYIRWYENVDGQGYEWKNHTVYIGVQGHYVSHGDMDGDGDEDLIAVTHAENTVAVFLAGTECDTLQAAECCHEGTQWNGTACVSCPMGTYGIGSGVDARCEACPSDTCTIPGRNLVPPTCVGITGCASVEASVAMCACPGSDTERDPLSDACMVCPAGQYRPDVGVTRGVETIGNYKAWELEQGVCAPPERNQNLNHIAIQPLGLTLMSIALGLSVVFAGWTIRNRDVRVVRASQPFFLIMICAGTFLMSLATLTFGIDDKNFSQAACDVACMSSPWLICVGFTIAFASIFSKLYRINKVFKSNLRKVKVTEKDVLKPFAVLFLLNIVVLITWTVVDPLRWSRQSISPFESYGTCRSEGTGVASAVCTALLALIALAALVLACIQAYQARAISDEYSESKYIGIAIICWLEVLIVGLPLMFLVKSNPTALYALESTLLFVVSTSLLLLVFVPKIRQRKVKRRKANVRVSIGCTPSSFVENRRASDASNLSNDSVDIDAFTEEGLSHHHRRLSPGCDGGRTYQARRGSTCSTASSVGGGGYWIESPQLQILDLKNEIQQLLKQNRELKTKYRQLEVMKESGRHKRSSVTFATTPDEETGSSEEGEESETEAEVVPFTEDIVGAFVHSSEASDESSKNNSQHQEEGHKE